MGAAAWLYRICFNEILDPSNQVLCLYMDGVW